MASKYIIDHECYGVRTEFDSIEEAQRVARERGEDFADVEFRQFGPEIVDDRGEVVGE